MDVSTNSFLTFILDTDAPRRPSSLWTCLSMDGQVCPWTYMSVPVYRGDILSMEDMFVPSIEEISRLWRTCPSMEDMAVHGGHSRLWRTCLSMEDMSSLEDMPSLDDMPSMEDTCVYGGHFFPWRTFSFHGGHVGESVHMG